MGSKRFSEATFESLADYATLQKRESDVAPRISRYVGH